MSSKTKILIYLFSFLVTITIVKFSFKDENLSNLALGKNTSTYYAKDTNKNNIHVSNIDSVAKSKIIKTWKLNGRKNVTLILGNSQTHSINQMQNGEYNYVEILDKKNKNTQIIANSFPNASIQDFLISYSYWKDYLRIKNIIIPVFFDDTRETNGIEYNFYPQLVNDNFVFFEDTQLQKNINYSLNLMRENLSGNSDVELSTQDKTELYLNDVLNEKWNSVWTKRKDVQGFIFSRLYLLRNFIFNITPSSTRRKIPERYFNNLFALDLIINDAVSNNFNVLFYIPPIRSDTKIPYDIGDYNLFINEVKSKTQVNNFIHFRNFSDIVPSSFFGTKESTTLNNNKELDFMHFQFQGHKILADYLNNYLDSIK